MNTKIIAFLIVIIFFIILLIRSFETPLQYDVPNLMNGNYNYVKEIDGEVTKIINDSEHIYCMNEDNKFEKISLNDGKTVQEIVFGSTYDFEVTTDNIFLFNNEGEVIIYEKETWNKVYETKIKDLSISSKRLVSMDDQVYFWDIDGDFAIIDTKFHVITRKSLDFSTNSDLVFVFEAGVAISKKNGVLKLFDSVNLDEKWSYKLEDRSRGTSSIASVENYLVVYNEVGVHIFDSEKDSLMKLYKTNAYQIFTLTDGVLVNSSNGSFLINPELLWNANDDYILLSEFQHSLYSTDYERNLKKVNKSDGKVHWKLDAFLENAQWKGVYQLGDWVLINRDNQGYIVNDKTGEVQYMISNEFNELERIDTYFFQYNEDIVYFDGVNKLYSISLDTTVE